MMRCIVVTFAQRIQPPFNFFLASNWIAVSEEFAPFVLVQSFGFAAQSVEGVEGRLLHLLLFDPCEHAVPPDVLREFFLLVGRKQHDRCLAHDVVFGNETPEAIMK